MLKAFTDNRVAKKILVKPIVTKILQESEALAKKRLSVLAKARTYDLPPELKRAVAALHMQAMRIIKDIYSEHTYNILVDIIARQPDKFINREKIKSLLEESAGAKKLTTHMNVIINLKNYSQLTELLKECLQSPSLGEEHKADLIKNVPVIDEILQENRSLNIAQLKTELVTLSMDVLADLELSKQESHAVRDYFEVLCKKYMSPLESIRKDFITHLPAFIECQKQKLSQARDASCLPKEKLIRARL